MRPLLSNALSNVGAAMTFGILATVVVAGILLVSVFFLMYGMVLGLGAVFVTQPWLGWVMTGGFFLLISILFLIVHFSKMKKSASSSSTITETFIQKIIDMTSGIDIKKWTQEHPYQSTGAAMAAGFIAAGKETPDIAVVLKETLLPLAIEHLQSLRK